MFRSLRLIVYEAEVEGIQPALFRERGLRSLGNERTDRTRSESTVIG